MFNQFLKGLVFGAGFSLAVIVIFTIWLSWAPARIVLDSSKNTFGGASGGAEIAVDPPALDDTPKFLGTSGSYDGEFEHFNARVLASGDGKIVGSISASGKPIGGVKIRLALNGGVVSQWVNSGNDGKYVIAVPYGQYRVDGYELDMDSAHAHLQGKIKKPTSPIRSGPFSVEPGKIGEGLHLEFVNPVIVLGPTGEVSLTDDIVARWEPYPGAMSYVVQVYEHKNPLEYAWSRTLFKWPKRPRVFDASMDLKEHGAELKPGHFYSLAIFAENDQEITISETPMSQREQNFKVID